MSGVLSPTTYPCGCRVREGGLAILWCPLHKAAPDLLAACERASANFADPVAAEERASRATDGNLTAFDAVLEALQDALAKVHPAVAASSAKSEKELS